MEEQIRFLCEQIKSAAEKVFIRGADSVAYHNLTQVTGIRTDAEKIISLLTAKGSEPNVD